MYFFNAIKKNKKIEVESNTYWSCNVYGNFMLSKNKGNGNDTIDIIIPREISSVNGTIIFSYGDERCNFPEIYIYDINNCYIRTIPDFQICKEGNILVMPYNNLGEIVTVIVLSNGEWSVAETNNCTFFVNGDELMAIPKGDTNSFIKIRPNAGCDNIITIKFKKTE